MMSHNMQIAAQVSAILKSMAAEAMGAEVDAEVPLMSAGLDSLGAVELRNGISAKFGISLPATFSFDYPTLQVAHIPDGPRQSSLYLCVLCQYNKAQLLLSIV